MWLLIEAKFLGLKLHYSYVRFKGDYYNFTKSKAWSDAPYKVWLGSKVNILLLSEKEIVSAHQHYVEHDEVQNTFKPNFSKAPFSKKMET